MERKKFLKIQSLVIAIIMLLQIILPIIPISYAEDHKGTVVDPWDISATDDDIVEAYVIGTTLYIQGLGKMKDRPSELYEIRNDITTVIIKNGVTNIGAYAFEFYENLTRITIPKSVNYIGIGAFFFCTKLASITIPQDVLYVERNTFYGCENLAEVILPEGLLNINERAFWQCNSLESITIPRNVTYVDSSAFGGCESLENILVDSNNEYFASQDGVLFNHDMTTLVCYPAGKEDTTYIVPEGVTKISGHAFEDGTFTNPLINIQLPSSLVIIENSAFQGLYNLENINIPEGVTNIEEFAFANCMNLTSLTIPSSVEILGNNTLDSEIYVIYGCEGLESIQVDSHNTKYSSEDGILFNKNKTSLICYPINKQAEQYTLPSSVNRIQRAAFYKCKNLRELIIPEGLATIGSTAFAYSNIEEINIPNSIEEIEDYAFAYCEKLSSISIPDGITSIGDAWFTSCVNLTNVDMPESITSIGNAAFQACSSLTSIEIPEGVTSIGTGAFSYCRNLKEIIIPAGVTNIGFAVFDVRNEEKMDVYYYEECEAMVEYVADNPNSANFIEIWNISKTEEDNVTAYIKGTTLYIQGTGEMRNFYGRIDENSQWAEKDYNEQIESIEIQSGVTNIGRAAFDNCKNLTNINIANTVTSIANNAFMWCESLETIALPSSITIIGENVFADCHSLREITIPEGVTTIETGLFFTCESLETVILPEGIKNIKSAAFEGCNRLEEINLPSSVETIEALAFDWCRSLREIIVPEGVTTIGEEAFATHREGRTDVYYYSECEAMVKYAANYPEEANFISINITGEGTIENPWNIGETDKDNVIAYIEENNGETVLNIQGTGAMQDFVQYIPWDYKYSKLITKVEIETGLTKIGNRAFYGCSNLSSIEIPESVTKIGSYAFVTCTSLEEIVIPESITAIADGTFTSCTNLNKVTLPEGITTIGALAFNDCSSLAEITIPTSVENLGFGAFATNKENKTDVYYYPECEAMVEYAANYPEDANFIEIALEEIQIETYPKTEYKARERLDLTGLTLKAIYNNGSEEIITEGYETSMADGTTLNRFGTQTITVTYEGKTISFNIRVVPNQIPNLLINSSELLSNGMLIKHVPLKMTVEDFKDNFNEDYEVSVDTRGAQYVGTGSIVTVTNGNEMVGEYELVVTGDVDGDGMATITDIFEVNSARLNAKTLEGAQQEAADANEDGNINVMDIFQINKFRFN